MKWQNNYADLLQKLAGQADQFAADATHMQKHQEDKLYQIMNSNRSTEIGSLYGFSSIKSVCEFQKTVPPTHYAHYEKDFSREHTHRFLAETVQHFAWTSGTSSSHKKIPICSALIHDFEAALLPWFDNLLTKYPNLTSGPAYWIVGPQVQVVLPESKTEMDDLAYFSPSLARCLSPILSTPPSTHGQGGFLEWAFCTLLHLLLEPELTWISIWSPTLFIELLESLKTLKPILIECFEQGNCDAVRLDLTPQTYSALNCRLFEKRSIIPYTLQRLTQNPDHPWQDLWPHLTLCSCWKDGWASIFLSQLHSYLPGVKIQGKGLLATEAIVSIPFEDDDSNDPVLAYKSHFYEFRSLNSQKIYLADELSEGEKYEVLVTTNGGLYRYQLDDVIQVTGFIGQAPRLRFLSKKSLISDLCGEKLHESHVMSCLATLGETHHVDLRHAFVRPVVSEVTRFYQLVVPQKFKRPSIKIEEALDEALSANPHYAACRKLQQLGPIELLLSPDSFTHHLSSTAKHYCLQTWPSFIPHPNIRGLE